MPSRLQFWILWLSVMNLSHIGYTDSFTIWLCVSFFFKEKDFLYWYHLIILYAIMKAVVLISSFCSIFMFIFLHSWYSLVVNIGKASSLSVCFICVFFAFSNAFLNFNWNSMGSDLFPSNAKGMPVITSSSLHLH